MANTRLTVADKRNVQVTLTTVLTGEIDPYWPILFGETFNAEVEGAAVGLGNRLPT